MENITFERIKNDEIIREYIRRADRNLAAMGYTKHSFGHVTKVAEGSPPWAMTSALWNWPGSPASCTTSAMW